MMVDVGYFQSRLPALGKVTRILDLILVVLLLLLPTALLWTHWVHLLGDQSPRRVLQLFFFVLSIRIAFALPWTDYLRTGRTRHFFWMAMLYGLALYLIYPVLTVSLPNAALSLITTRIAFSGLDDDRIMSVLTRHSRNLYPLQDFVVQARTRIDVNEAVAYLGDQDGHIISAQLYPRRVYMLPQLQLILLKTKQIRRINQGDPYHARQAKAAPRLKGLEDPAVRQAFAQMIIDKQIKWLITYHALEPLENSSIKKLD